MKKLLWVLQALLAALFVFAGVMKFVMPADVMTKGTPLTASFLYFIGVCEILGGIGLILPSMLKIKPGLAPLAAAGLIVIMIGAVVTTVMWISAGQAVTPFVVGVLLVVVMWGRWRVAPIEAK